MICFKKNDLPDKPKLFLPSVIKKLFLVYPPNFKTLNCNWPELCVKFV